MRTRGCRRRGVANEYSVRVWPWMCVARGNLSGPGGIGGGVGGSPTGVKGLVWREAVSGADGGARTMADEARAPRVWAPLASVTFRGGHSSWCRTGSSGRRCGWYGSTRG